MSYLEKGKPSLDREYGELAEKGFFDILQKIGRHPEYGLNGVFTDYDIKDENYTYEIKSDRRYSETRNVYVEKKSLFNSKTDYFVYHLPGSIDIDPDTYWLIPTKALRRSYQLRKEISGGDFSEPGVLFPLEEFVKLFKKININNS